MLFLYFADAPVLCILVLTLSSGIVESTAQHIRSRRKMAEYAQTVINPAMAPAPNVMVDDNFPVAGFVQSSIACWTVAYEVNRTALFAPCFMICGISRIQGKSCNQTHGRR